MLRTTREKLGTILSANMMTRTVKSDYLKGTIWWDEEVTSKWIVSYIGIDEDYPNVLTIEVIHPDYK